MKYLEQLQESGERGIAEVLSRIPYVKFMGIQCEQRGNELTFCLPASDHLIGNPKLPAIHGGATGAFLETAAIMQLAVEIQRQHLPKTIDFSIEYLRSARLRNTYARARVAKAGRRVANVRVEAWQEERDRPVAFGYGNFLLDAEDEPQSANGPEPI